jgi:hypothetical protein
LVFLVVSFFLVFPPITYTHFIFPHLPATCPAHVVLLDLIILIILGEENKSRSSSLRSFLHSPVTSSLLKSRRMRWAGHVTQMGEKRNAYRLLVEKPGGRRPLGRPRRRWVDLVEVGWGDVDWIGLGEDRDRWRALVNAVLNLRVP